MRASLLPPAAATLPSVQPPKVRPLSHLSLLAFVTFVFFTLRCHLFSYLAVTFFSSSTHTLSHIFFHFSYLMKPDGGTVLILLSVVLPFVALKIILRQYFSCYINAGTSSLLRTSVHPFSSFLRASAPPDAVTLPSVKPPTFVCFLTFLYCLL